MAKAPPSHPGPPPDLPPELANHPRFRVVRELGRGGMGVVYQAEHRMMERRVALKVIRRALLDHPDALARFHAEVKAAARLSHPNIVAAYDAEQAGDLHLLVMEYVEGTDLARVLARKGPLAVAHACHFARQAALGLQHAHEQGMAHRDIKPQNLMLTPRGRVKVLDFGLARLRSEQGQTGGLTQQGAFMGTPEYVAPEQAADARAADIRADIYSLGCTLYALLTGNPPFAGDTALTVVLAHLQQEPPPLRTVRPDAPPELEAVVARMLEKDPARRYQTPAEVAQALAPFAKPGQAAAPAGGSTEERPAPGVGRRRRMLVLAAVAGAAVLGLAVLLAVTLPRKAGDGVATPKVLPAVSGPSERVAAKVPAYVHDEARWHVEGDELVPDAKDEDALLLFGDPSWTDYHVTVEVRRNGGGGLFRLFFRCADVLNHWGLAFGVRAKDGSGLVGVGATVNGAPKGAGPERQPWAVDSAWHKLGVQVEGGHIQCFLDGSQVFDLTDDRHPQGCVGFAVGKQTAYRIRNLKVTGTGGRVLVDGISSLDLAGGSRDVPVSDPAAAGTVWKGIYRPGEKSQDAEVNKVTLKVRKREGMRVEGELWGGDETRGLEFEGTLDPFGNFTFRPTKIVAGEWSPEILKARGRGVLQGNQIHGCLIVPPPEPHILAELDVTRQD